VDNGKDESAGDDASKEAALETNKVEGVKWVKKRREGEKEERKWAKKEKEE